MSKTNAPEESDPGESRTRLWFAVISPAAAWALQEMLSALIADLACERHRAPGVARALVLAVSLVALAFTVGGGLTGYRAWRGYSTSPDIADDEGKSAESALAIAAVFMGVIFTLGVFWGGLPGVMLSRACEARR